MDMAQEVDKTVATDQMVVLATKPTNTTSHTHSFASLFGRYRNSWGYICTSGPALVVWRAPAWQDVITSFLCYTPFTQIPLDQVSSLYECQLIRS